MELSEVQKPLQPKDVIISLRVSTDKSEWMKRNNVSPTMLFNKSLEELQMKVGEDGFKQLAKWKGK